MKLFSHLRVGRPHGHKTRLRRAARTPPRCRLYLERLEDRTAPAVSVLHSFAGMSFSDTTSGGEPPDTILAAGPNHVVELVNTAFRVYRSFPASSAPWGPWGRCRTRRRLTTS